MDRSGFAHGVDPRHFLIVRGARQHNLKNVDLDLPKYRINVITGPSGSGKSSLAFDTIFAEGQRRYMESLSAYARQFLVRMDKPDVDYLGGLAPAIAIEQKALARNPRSTVATQTEIYDHLRLLFAQIGTTISPVSKEAVTRDAPRSVADALARRWDEGTRFYLAFPASSEMSLAQLRRLGYARLLYVAGTGTPHIMDVPDQEKPPALQEKVYLVQENVYVLQDRLVIRKGDEANATRIADSVQQAYTRSGGYCIAVQAREDGEVRKFNEHFERDGVRFMEPTTHLFSFNSPAGACPTCKGFGRRKGLDSNLVIPDQTISLRAGAVAPFRDMKKWEIHNHHLMLAAMHNGINVDIPYYALPKAHKSIVWNGADPYIGILPFFQELQRKFHRKHYRFYHARYQGFTTCADCDGTRLRPEALYVQIGGLHIGQVLELTTKDAQRFFDRLLLTPFEEEVASILLGEIRKRLRFLVEVGLEYVTLDRPSQTLSGGESQRINLASSLGSSLVGSLYVLDEPTVGLHPRDTLRLINILKRLRDLGNTVLVVEHDAEVMRHADEIVDLGPGSGHRGGAVTYQGSYQGMLACETSLTGMYLSARRRIPVPEQRRTPDWSAAVTVANARAHNLKRLTVAFPLHVITVVTGVSGSGKSTLVHDTLYRGLRRLKGLSTGNAAPAAHDEIRGYDRFDRVEMVDQSPIGRSPRSNPVTYTKAFDGIRQLLAKTEQARLRGYRPGYFSFNVDGGRCEQCKGEGTTRVEMQFLADMFLECEECEGRRFRSEVLEVRYKGKNVDDILKLTVDEAVEFFSGSRAVTGRLRVLSEIGLGYLRLGQPATTLSGGEAQRIKLAAHLGAAAQEHILYIFDEPTTGLHFDDIRKLLLAFNHLVDKGHTVIVVEHNLDMIKAADWIIDLGPEGGFAGGSIVAQGPPELVAQEEASHTGRHLREILRKKNLSQAVTFPTLPAAMSV